MLYFVIKLLSCTFTLSNDSPSIVVEKSLYQKIVLLMILERPYVDSQNLKFRCGSKQILKLVPHLSIEVVKLVHGLL